MKTKKDENPPYAPPLHQDLAAATEDLTYFISKDRGWYTTAFRSQRKDFFLHLVTSLAFIALGDRLDREIWRMPYEGSAEDALESLRTGKLQPTLTTKKVYL